jgi:multicomponent Na+:H+ antiporter subunit E
MNYFLLNLGLTLVWAMLTGVFRPANLLIGFGLGYLTLLVARRALGPSAYFGKVHQVLGFAVFFLGQLLLANLRVAAEVLTPKHHMQPRVIAVPLEPLTDTEITTLSNLISLTPGTLSLDVSTDRRVLYIHAMYASDAEALRHEIKDGLERRVITLLRETVWQPRGKE